jgi:hypothetical protein
MSTSRAPWIWLLVALLFLPFGSYVVFEISLYTIADWVEGWHSAGSAESSNAEIIVLVPEKVSDNSPEGFSAELIPLSYARDYPSEHPGATFFIPIDRQNQIKERLQTTQKLSWTTFEIKNLSDSQEQITLDFMDRTDDTHGSRYKAAKGNVQLESYRYVSDRGGIGIVFLAMLVTLCLDVLVVGSVVGRAIHVRRKNLRSQNAAR